MMILRATPLATLTMVALCGCNRPETTANPATQIAAAPGARSAAVKTVRPLKKSLVRTVEQPGSVEPFEEAPLFVRIPGYVNQVLVDIGDKVKGPSEKGELGQVLAELSVPEMEEENRQKRALVARAEAMVEQAQASLEAAQARVNTAQAMVREAEAGRTRVQANYARWESEHRRIGKLVQQNVIDQQTLDETQNQFRSAEGLRQEAEAKVASAQATAREAEANQAKAKADLSVARTQVRVAQAEEKQSAAMLQYRQVTAPFAGVVTRRNISRGHFVQPAHGAGTPLFVVARIDPVRVMVDVPETDAGAIQVGMPATVRIKASTEQEFHGKVTRTSWSLDPKARTLRVEVDLPNPEGQLRPGMYSYVSLRAEFPDRLTVPAAAVIAVSGQPGIHLVRDGKAVFTPVKLGAREGALVEIVAIQVRAEAGDQRTWASLAGEEVVAIGADLKDGDRVSVSPTSTKQ